MNKPYILCHMMMSLDGRIDCAITASIDGSDEYYETLEALDTPSHVSGRVTAELEMALPGKFESAKDAPSIGKTAFSKNQTTDHYEIVLDTHGTLLWPKAKDLEDPLLIVVSEQGGKIIWTISIRKYFLDCLRKRPDPSAARLRNSQRRIPCRTDGSRWRRYD
ncbi:hypothetical protein [Allobaculum sp. Allo2]|uniref:hypothetical protein n=1 Tax=Allobaculum sp. Allo2 TaxID=2853432 RepID=UPI001F61313A|nr:hypothetical protein [Allobaculum sp. Allo2]